MNTSVEVLGFAREPGWLPWAVQYFFLIGISTAAFFLSLPGLVWRHPDWRGIRAATLDQVAEVLDQLRLAQLVDPVRKIPPHAPNGAGVGFDGLGARSSSRSTCLA